jgi:hypothetical protein
MHDNLDYIRFPVKVHMRYEEPSGFALFMRGSSLRTAIALVPEYLDFLLLHTTMETILHILNTPDTLHILCCVDEDMDQDEASNT